MTARKNQVGVAGYILAGGGSTRFGRDKALVEFDGQPMLARMMKLMRSVTNDLQLVATPGKYVEFGAQLVADGWPGQGPLGGIITALENAAESPANCEWNLIVSCDMPFLTQEWLAFLAERAVKSKAEVVFPHSASGPEPLCACWQTDAAAKLRSGFERGVRKVMEGIALLRAEVLDEADWKRFDSAGRLFWNMNTAMDYEEARRILEAERT
jgi:molybdopterin-guanine dinucleotide biosynthesis protein A